MILGKNNFIVCVVLLSSCSIFNPNKGLDSNVFSHSATRFEMVDKSGEFFVDRERGYNKKKSLLVVKSKTFSKQKSDLVVEQIVSASTPGKLGKNLPILRPSFSEYTVWFDGKKYRSTIKLDVKKKSFVLELESPEKQWQGTKIFPVLDGKGIYCFYEQIIECAGATGFLKKAAKLDVGEMKLFLVWNGYPFFQEQYSDVDEGVFVSAVLKYDGKNRNEEARFSLKTEKQVQFFFLDKNFDLKKHFWVSQGFSKVREGSVENDF